MTGDHWFEDLADHLGPAYLRYSFTYGTEQEVDFLVSELGLPPGSRILDVGCGPGRHAKAGFEIGEPAVHVTGEHATPVEHDRLDAHRASLIVPECEGRPFRVADTRELGLDAQSGVSEPAAGSLVAPP